MMMMKFSHENVISSLFHKIVFYGQNVSQNDSIDARAHLYDPETTFEMLGRFLKQLYVYVGPTTRARSRFPMIMRISHEILLLAISYSSRQK